MGKGKGKARHTRLGRKEGQLAEGRAAQCEREGRGAGRKVEGWLQEG